MEQAINLFTKGLQLDTSPMVQGNDTLTDCLNGTIVTMNGNEVILLNDMGNRRVDNAYLPAGYQPVGMKEYGGVIYVASYNPITNKSLLGSFPSPLRKIHSEDSLKGVFDFNYVLTNNNDDSDNIEENTYFGVNVLKSDTFLIPLTEDNNLHAGDKFTIYAQNLSNIQSMISNYNNVIIENDGKVKVYSPKNRRYTLSVGILNSLNEFVDITKTLYRWKKYNDKWDIVVYDDSYSDIIKFNDGYFISDEFDIPQLDETLSDKELILLRLKLAVNTYAYKLTGPMYLKVVLNHSQNFDYTIHGIKNGSLTTLWVEGLITYNCPDGINSDTPTNDDIYHTFLEGSVSDKWYDFFIENNGNLSKITPDGIYSGGCVYNKESNTYTVKVIKTYNILYDENILNYVIGVLADNDTADIYLKGLSIKGSIDLSLLGSGLASLSGWKFYNNVNSKQTILKYSFEAYPEYGLKFENLRFRFTNLNDSSDVFTYPDTGILDFKNGATLTIGWGDLFKERLVYKVSILYDAVSEGETETITIDDAEYWLITTELFNEFYSDYNISNFCTTQDLDFLNKMKVSLKGNSTISNQSKRKNPVYDGGLIAIIPDGQETANASYNCTYEYEIDIQNNPYLSIVNEYLYPDTIKILDNHKTDLTMQSFIVKSVNGISNSSFSTSSGVNDYLKQKLNDSNSKIVGRDYGEEIETLFENLTVYEESHTITLNKIKGSLKYYDRFLAKADLTISNAHNVFDKISNALESILPTSGFYGGITPMKAHHSGGGDYHAADIYINFNTPYLGQRGQTPEDATKFTIHEEDKNGEVSIELWRLQSQIYQAFKQCIQNRKYQTFMFLVPYSKVGDLNDTVGYSASNSGTAYRKSWATDGLARVWWRNAYSDRWSLFPTLFKVNISNTNSIKDDFQQYLENVLGHDYIYCMYDTKELTKVKAKGENYAYYKNEDTIPIVFNINYGLSSSINSILSLNNCNIGNLLFTGGSINNLNTTEISFDLKYNDEFKDTIIRFSVDDILNIDLNTGLSKDSDNNNLSPLYCYYLDTSNGSNKLVRSTLPIMIDPNVKDPSGRKILTWNGNKLGSPLLKYDLFGESSGDDDAFTALDYSDLFIIYNI